MLYRLLMLNVQIMQFCSTVSSTLCMCFASPCHMTESLAYRNCQKKSDSGISSNMQLELLTAQDPFMLTPHRTGCLSVADNAKNIFDSMATMSHQIYMVGCKAS